MRNFQMLLWLSEVLLLLDYICWRGGNLAIDGGKDEFNARGLDGDEWILTACKRKNEST